MAMMVQAATVVVSGGMGNMLVMAAVEAEFRAMHATGEMAVTEVAGMPMELPELLATVIWVVREAVQVLEEPLGEPAVPMVPLVAMEPMALTAIMANFSVQ
jgi:hypothetical protein